MDWRSALIGLLAGFLLEWLVDVAILRRRLRQQPEPVPAPVSTPAEPTPTIYEGENEDVMKLRDENVRLTHTLSQLKQENDELRLGVRSNQWRLDQAIKEIHETRSTKVVAIVKDIFERIEGIGPVYQQRLWESGILKYSDLAATSEERLRDIIHPQEWQNLDFLSWRRAAAIYAAEAMEQPHE
ncbi:MAG: hypothetical protein JNJ45_09800 [Chthonomonas sp.]|nr:hypothetical protein [Chthonomonas sp.]